MEFSTYDNVAAEPANDVSDEAGYVAAEGPLVRSFIRLRTRLTSWIEREFGGGPPYPEDILQQTFAKLAERDNLEKVEHLDSYAWVTAINCVRSEQRAARVAESYLQERQQGFWNEGLDEFDPERVLRARQELDIVAKTLQQMSSRRRTIFMAARFEGLSQDEAGKKAGVSRNAAVRHIAIATDLLTKALAKGGTFDESQGQE
ncbi:MAG: RNA polymerase sigma factor [Pseudomonadota bacterium]